MNFQQFLNESPIRVQSSKDDIKNVSLELFKRMKLKNNIGFINNKTMYRDGDNFALVDNETKKPYIFISYSKSHHPRAQVKNQYTQNLLWKHESIPTKDLEYFFISILGEVGTIYSSNEQTDGGRKFWERVIKKYAATRYYEIGYFDAETGSNVVVKSKDGVDDMIKHVYVDVEYSKVYIKDLENS